RSDPMFETDNRHLVIDSRSAGARLDLYIAAHFKGTQGPELSRSEIQRLIGEGQITLNGSATKASARIKPNDRIEIRLPPPREGTVCSEALPLEILYE